MDGRYGKAFGLHMDGRGAWVRKDIIVGELAFALSMDIIVWRTGIRFEDGCHSWRSGVPRIALHRI